MVLVAVAQGLWPSHRLRPQPWPVKWPPPRLNPFEEPLQVITGRVGGLAWYSRLRVVD